MGTEVNRKEGNQGFWNSIRETIVCEAKDLSGRRFEMRFLVDPGATISTIPFYTLALTGANWDIEQIRAISISGINSLDQCDLVCHAIISPGEHLGVEFKREVKLPQNYQLEVDLFLMRGMQVFTSYKHALPRDIVSTLSGKKYHLADPQQISPRDQMLYIHGILGVKAITQMGRQAFEAVPGTDMTTCRSYFGDLLFGASHFIPAREKNTSLPLNDDTSRVDQINIACSSHYTERGLVVDDGTIEKSMAQLGINEYVLDPTLLDDADF